MALKYRISKKDWEDIRTVVNMIAADNWDIGSYGKRPDFEKLLEKINERIETKKGIL